MRLDPACIKNIKKGEALALIPARGGSKRVPNKNILPLGGKALIGHTILQAQKAQSIGRILISTDSEEIAKAAEGFGVKVPFLRPPELACDSSTEFEFHVHALNWLFKNEGYVPEFVVNLYPTTPFRSAKTIDLAIARIRSIPDADSLRSTRRVSEHPFKMWIKDGDFLTPFVKKENESVHTSAYHLLPPVQIQNASIYIVKPETLAKYENTIGKSVLSFEMSEEESVDINTKLDFITAEAILRNDHQPL